MNPINIVCATDGKYVPYCGVMLTSLFENNKEREINVYILIDKALPANGIAKFEKLAKRYHQTINFCKVDSSFFENFPIKGNGVGQLSIVTYYRIYAADLLPQTVDKVLYLDCDIIVNRPIGELFDMDWTDIAIGGVPDMCIEWQEFYDRLQYDKSLGYFNAGVVMLNLAYWRKHNIAQQCLDYLANNYAIIENNDQDVLNYVMREKKRMLPITYNYQTLFLTPYIYDTLSHQMQADVVAEKSPTIIHYASQMKPWMAYYYSHPFYTVWKKYKKLSPWRCMPEMLPKKLKLVAIIKRYLIWPFGLWLKKPQLIEGWKE